MTVAPTTTRIIRETTLVRVPWKNGGGATAEIAVHPVGAGFDDFDWRISMADVAQDGPFSAFPGIDRTLVLIAGDGITLEVDGVAHDLDRSHPMLRFSGEARTESRLRNGPIRDFNVMTRQGRVSQDVRSVTAEVFRALGTTLVFAHGGPASIMLDGKAHQLDRYDAVLVADAVQIEVERAAVVVSLSAL